MKTTKTQAHSLLSGAVLGLAGIAGTAQASIVDFEVGANSCYSTVCSGVQGFDFAFVAAGWGVSDDGNTYFNRNGRGSSEGLAGGHGVGNGAPPLSIIMTQVGGGAFGLGQLDMATGLGSFTGMSSIDVIGDIFGGGQITQTIQVSSTWANYSLTGFGNVTQVMFRNRDAIAGVSIDNLNSKGGSTVPEPGSLALVGLASLGLWASRRRSAN